MATTDITVQEIRPPRPGGKKYVLVDTSGDFYYIWPNEAQNYAVGESYRISYSTQTFRGNTIRSIESASRSAAPQRAAPAATPQGAATGGSTWNSGGGGDQRDQGIFVNMGIKESIRAQLLDPHNVEATVALGRSLREAHKQIWAPMPQPQRTAPQQQVHHPELNDDIPF